MSALTNADGVFLLTVTLGVIYLHQRSMSKRQHGEIMAAIDDLNTALDSISTEVGKIATETQNLIDELKAANEKPEVDLTGVIAKAEAIQAKLQAVDALVPDAPVAE